MAIKIDKKITGFDVSKEEPSDVVENNVIQMHEKTSTFSLALVLPSPC